MTESTTSSDNGDELTSLLEHATRESSGVRANSREEIFCGGYGRAKTYAGLRIEEGAIDGDTLRNQEIKRQSHASQT